MNSGSKNLFAAAAVLSAGLMIVFPATAAYPDETAVLVSDECDASVEEAIAAKSEPKGKQVPLRVNFDKALHCLTMNIYHTGKSF